MTDATTTVGWPALEGKRGACSRGGPGACHGRQVNADPPRTMPTRRTRRLGPVG